jgi:predicted O-linked N-acetylglucosamine transferase (SPINDLY family)
VLELRPDVGLAYFGLGKVLAASGNVAAAIDHYRSALDRMPTHAESHFNLANLLYASGEYAEAEIHYRTALELKPGDPATWINLGNTLKQQGALAEASNCYELALRAAPHLVEAHTNLANTRMEMGDFRAALEGYRRAAELRPDAAESHLHLAHALSNIKETGSAIRAYRRALSLQPDLVDAHVNLAHLFKSQGDLENAKKAYRAASKADPNSELHSLREATLCPLVFCSSDEMEAYRRQFQHTVESLQHRVGEVPLAKVPQAFSECPYNLQFLDGNLRSLKESYADIFQAYFQHFNESRTGARGSPRSKGKPRIGFVVTAGHERAFLRLIADVVRRIDPGQFEVMIVCSVTGADKLRKGLGSDAMPLVEYVERFDRAVETIRSAAFDLLYYWEIGTDPTNYFLPFLRLAPVQCTSWGIQVTSGIPQVDYYLSSDLVEPEGAESHYRERLVRARTLLTYQPTRNQEVRAARSELGFSEDQHLYGCVQNLGKFHPDFDDALGEILRRDPAGWLVLSQDQAGHAARILQQRFASRLADVAARIVFLPPRAHGEYLRLIASCDVLLEPLHFGGVTTTYDALSLDKPLVAMRSPYQRGRYAAGCYRSMDYRQCLAKNCNEYVNLANQLGCDTEFRAHVARQIREAKHAVFDDLEAVREHERIFGELLADVMS